MYVMTDSSGSEGMLLQIPLCCMCSYGDVSLSKDFLDEPYEGACRVTLWSDRKDGQATLVCPSAISGASNSFALHQLTHFPTVGLQARLRKNEGVTQHEWDDALTVGELTEKYQRSDMQ